MAGKEAPFSEKPGYQRSPELMSADDTLMCVVDLQARLLPVIRGHEQVVWNARRLLDAARILGVEAVATEQYPEKLGPTVEPLAGLLRLTPPGKQVFSSAACSELFARHIEQFGEGGRHRVLLSGIETHVCVQQTAYDLMAAGFQVFLAVDATGTRNALDHEIALRRMESAGVVLTTTEAAIFEWCREAGTPQFKQISELVKEEGSQAG